MKCKRQESSSKGIEEHVNRLSKNTHCSVEETIIKRWGKAIANKRRAMQKGRGPNHPFLRDRQAWHRSRLIKKTKSEGRPRSRHGPRARNGRQDRCLRSGVFKGGGKKKKA